MNIWSPWKKLPITLPDQSSQTRAIGYTWALYKHADLYLDMILEHTPAQTTTKQHLFNGYLAHCFRSTHPEEKRLRDQDELEYSRGAAFTFIKCPYIQTNNPGLFQDLYGQGFVEGYRFCYFACAEGLLELLYMLPKQYWWSVAIHFGWERMAPDTVPLLGTTDIPMDKVLEYALSMLRDLHQCYLQVSQHERRF